MNAALIKSSFTKHIFVLYYFHLQYKQLHHKHCKIATYQFDLDTSGSMQT